MADTPAKALPRPPGPPAEDVGEPVARARDDVGYAVAPRTEQAYGTYWAAFQTWCEGHAVPALPSLPTIVAAYLAERSVSLGRSGLRLILAAIAHHHRRAGYPWSSRDPVIASALRGIPRQRPVRPAAALTPTEIGKLLDTCGGDPAGYRDRALLLLGFAGALRRAELVAIDREHLRFTGEGLVLAVPPSGRGQAGRQAALGIPRGPDPPTCPVRAVEEWLRRAGIAYGAVFRRLGPCGLPEGRLTANGVWKILRRRAAIAGLTVDAGERLGPHGLRAGRITVALRDGMSAAAVRRLARQSSRATTQHYRLRDREQDNGPAPARPAR
ncbi:tyrosine-type recombinase/integrase [Roseomonas sp. NAR14]|uniref:Tyrosine-type recombinase/integrase n=1 Tax=Roseomonas acroporae TaxID=2937791 RepID=A0A9X1YG39_9PROT|nr:tyrosine-type recombinase/integrase [Roseomonas acroporae]MCK8788057.1 tyrosine-type recombinase/integrase [Roseomonas acroporae]